MQDTIIEDADILGAASAITKITDNEKHFCRIESLKVENWLH